MGHTSGEKFNSSDLSLLTSLMLIPTESQLPLQTYQHHPEKQKNQKIKHLEAEQSNTKDVLSFYFF